LLYLWTVKIVCFYCTVTAYAIHILNDLQNGIIKSGNSFCK